MTKFLSVDQKPSVSSRARKATTGLLIGALAVITLGGVVSPAQASSNFWLYKIENNNVTVTGVAGYVTPDLVIPSELEGSPVTAIGADAFQSRQLTSLEMPDSVTSIGAHAFENNQLTVAIIPNSTITIGNYAFAGNQLTMVLTGGSLETIGLYAFNNNLLTSLIIPSSVLTIGREAFSTNKLTSLTIGQSVTSIGDSAFYNNLLASVTIPSSVTSIGASAFYNNKLTSLTIPNSVTSIGSGAFGVNLLTTVTFLGNAPSYESGVFSTNPDLSILDVPKNSTGWTATWSGVAVRLPEIFTYTTEANKVTVTGCISTCPTALVIPATLGGNPVTKIGAASFSQRDLTSVTLPSSLLSIDGNAFSNNLLATVTIPYQVTTIGTAAFASNTLTSVEIGTAVTTIEQAAFSNNKLASITIPWSVTTIGKYAFYTNKLTSVTFDTGVTSIDDQAFYDNQLTSVTFSGNSPTAGADVFGNNTALTLVTAYANRTGWSDTWSSLPVNLLAFKSDVNGSNEVRLTGLYVCPSNLVLPATLGGNPVTSVKAWFLGNSECAPTSLTVPASVTSIEAGAFAYAKFSSIKFLGNAPTEIAGVFDVNAASFIDVPFGATGYGATWSDIPVRFAPGPVVAKAPVYVSGAKITGSHKVSSVLTATAGKWTSATAKTTTFAWYVCNAKVSTLSKTGKVASGCKAIAKATGKTYLTKTADKSKFIAAKITVKNRKGSSSVFTKTIGSVDTW